MTPLVSVIIPTYKHSHYILSTLSSVFSQTFVDYEVIVINDGSPDDTAQVLFPLIESGKIQYLEQANQGQAAARNRGIAEAKGEYIAFLDDDDLWPPDKLQWQVSLMEKHPEVGMVGGSAELIDESGAFVNKMYYHEGILEFKDIFKGCPFSSPGQTLIRSQILKKVGGLDESLRGTDDFDLWFKISYESKILASKELALKYRMHSSNASKDAEGMFLSSLYVVRHHLKRVPKRFFATARRNAYRWLYFYSATNIVRSLKDSLGAKRKIDSRHLKIVSVFLLPALNDPRLFKRILSDIIPESFKRLAHSILKRNR